MDLRQRWTQAEVEAAFDLVGGYVSNLDETTPQQLFEVVCYALNALGWPPEERLTYIHKCVTGEGW